MSTNLVATDSDKYIRRLVKEIRASFEHGVYVELPNGTNKRFQAVQFSKGLLLCKANGQWFEVSRQSNFGDGYGRSIHASRAE
jgi:hypothetical protein